VETRRARQAVSSQIAMKGFRLTTSSAAKARYIVTYNNNTVFTDANTVVSEEGG
jgi:hypothetical protein